MTVDLPVLGYRERDRRNRFDIPGAWDRAFSVRGASGREPITELDPGTLTWREPPGDPDSRDAGRESCRNGGVTVRQ